MILLLLLLLLSVALFAMMIEIKAWRHRHSVIPRPTLKPLDDLGLTDIE